MATPKLQRGPAVGADVIRPRAFQVEDAALVAAARRGEPDAHRRLFERYASHVGRLLTRLLGPSGEIADLIQEVFFMALRDLGRLKEPNALKGWLSSISVHIARGHMRHRKRRRWLVFFAPSELPEVPVEMSDADATEAMRRTYALLDTLPSDERIAFALRVIDDMDLRDVAEACGTSLATIKRRLVRAEASFVAAAERDAVLRDWLQGGTRWGTQ